MTVMQRFRNWPWLTLQIIIANVTVIAALAMAWYLTFMHQSNVYSERLMSTFNIEPGRLHTMYVDDVERQLWISVTLGLIIAILASIGLTLLIARPLRSLAKVTERLRHGDYHVRSPIEKGEVGSLAENFNALAEGLEQEERRRAQFMTDLGHELRTPIMSLQGYTEGLEDGVFKADDGYFKLIASELSHLTMLTHTIQNLQLDSVQLVSKTTIDEMLDSAKLRWSTRFHQRGLQLDLTISTDLANRQLNVSSKSIRQILDNLFSNMFRYASADGPCVITVQSGKQIDFVTIACSNEAPDITQEALPFLFDRFYRVSESRTRVLNEHPSGLGLSVVKQLCIANNGNVTASLQNSRLVVSVHLPLHTGQGVT